MDLNEYQQLAQQTAIYKDQRSIDGLTYSVLALCGETGELANKLKKHLRAGTKPDSLVLADELGDVLWYVSAVARELGLDLETVANMNLEKLAERAAQKKLIG
jgi:NTP pyrophosphatase (non-canonical NTP hydrolase)